MKKTSIGLSRRFLAAACVLGLTINPLYATPWTVLGPRAMGMGGAYTAVAEGPVGAYWNPAGQGQPEDPSGLSVPVSVHGAFVGSALQGANDINQIYQTCSSNPAACPGQQNNINNALNAFSQTGSGAMMDAGAGMQMKFSRLTFFVNELGVAGATPQVDLVHNTPATIAQNTSALLMNGIAMTEFGVGYGHTLGENTGLNVGVNLKGIIGKTGFDEFNVVQNDTGKGALSSNLKNNTASSFQPGVDAGLLWDMREALPDVWWRPRLAVVGRNLNNPKFDQPTATQQSSAFTGTANTNKFSVQGQGRAGLALSPMHFWTIAADVDLTNNLTPLQGYKSRLVSLGTEVNVFNRSWIDIPLRAGLTKNVSANDKMSLAAGFGLNFLHVLFDVSGSVSPNKTTIQTQGETKTVPSDVSVSAQFSILFGGRDYKAPEKPRHSDTPPATTPTAITTSPAPTAAPPAAKPK